MTMFPLSYNTNGLANLSLEQAAKELVKAGYEGIEIFLDPVHLHPYEITKRQLRELKRLFDRLPIEVASMATGGMHVLGPLPFEPSLISPDARGRKERVDLICEALEIANFLSIPAVNFTSGIKHPGVPDDEATDMLLEGVRACLPNVGDAILMIEQEPLIPPLPDMFIYRVDQAISLIEEIDSPKLRLSLDVAHAKCREDDYLEAIARAVPYARHVHVADIKGRDHHHDIPGESDIDFRSVFQILGDANYEHYVSVELYWHCDEWEKAVYESRRYLLEQMKPSEEGS